MKFIDECTLLGASMIGAQKFEFALYGLVSHLIYAYDGKDKRFLNLTPEKFLRGSVGDLKITLGQLENAFGEKLLISSNELKEFIKHRNLIAHNYWRLSRSNIKDGEKLDDAELFLRNFIQTCDHWQSIINGCLYIFMEKAAEKENRSDEINFSDKQKKDINSYYKYVGKHRDNGDHS